MECGVQSVHVGCESSSAQSKFNLQDRNCYINLNLVQHYSPQATALVTTTKCFPGGAAQGYFHLATTRRKLKMHKPRKLENAHPRSFYGK